MLQAGDNAPDFTLPDQNGDELTLSSLRGETVVLYFYPRADTPGSARGCARAGKARSIAVATGTHGVDELRASGADVVFQDLSDTDAVMAAIYNP